MFHRCYRSGPRAGLLPAAPAHFAGRGRPTRLPPQAAFETGPRSAELADPPITSANAIKSDVLPDVPTDPDLARVVEAWPALPDPIRRAMLALVASAQGVG